ncbi:YkyA family protein [Lacicoccus alkaliphilus]|uniref:Putative cell-wall binding lipoprotein n=1 Tax=Lacicoccus alkaliphilus DSM 16010 TaxID=1123231 RepID=A0A1M7CMW5_9BACL|nr:YkyA family protein [Salinicoccus alkaliphilus]SHL68596.1 Putative cell-wall binding lipoprotein [Salinicoccus alkaliphilus DSM 16010]
MKKIAGLMMAGLVFLLASCSNEMDELEGFYTEFQETLDIEAEISDISEEYNALENERGRIQDSLPTAERSELTEMGEALADNTEERLGLIREEQEVMAASEEQAAEASEEIDDISNAEYRQQAEALIAAADERYDVHDELMGAFESVLGSEMNLFEHLQTEELNQDTIDDRINTLNEEYEALSILQSEFATATERLNEVKDEVYSIFAE